MLSKIYVWIVVFSFGLYVSCEPCSNKTKDCPKTVTVLKTMSKVIYETCYKATKTCWGWNVLKIKCKYKSRSDRCTKHKSYYITTTMVLPGCCEGYTEEEDCCVKDLCPKGQWGQNCTHNCSCETNNFEKCHMLNGSCFCKPGWFGSKCAEQCPSGTYGVDCQWNCSCEQNATCDHVTGACNCSSVVGWTGLMCNEECSSGYFGTNCSSLCNCTYKNQECDRMTGDCRCIPGKTGPSCNQGCSKDAFKFGFNCTQPCDCIKANSVFCDPANGSCVCKPGWKGDKCEKGCDPFRYGNECQENCTCAGTNVCDPVNGTCLSAGVCFAEHTSNCMPSSNVTCSQLKENCGDNETTEQEVSLKQSMLDICCEGGIQKILCISTNDCDCKPGFLGHNCNTSTRLDNLRSEDDNSTVQLPLVLVPVVLVMIAVALAIVFVIRKKKRSSSEHTQHYASNKSYGETRFQTVEGTSDMALRTINASDREHPEDSEDYNMLQRQGLNLQDGETNMYSVNKNDVNDYGYDVSVHAPIDDDNENYSSTVGGETYDHLERDNALNNVKETQIEDTYSHAHQSAIGEDEYHVVNGGQIPLESDYDHTNDHTDDKIYSNTSGRQLQGPEANDVYA